MWIDTHVHLLPTKKSRPDWEEIDFTFQVASKKGIDVIFLTEHRDALGFDELYSEIFGENKLGGDVQENGVIVLPCGLMISSGAEISLKGGGDIGVHASVKALMDLKSLSMAYTATELLSEFEAGGGSYVTVAHHLLGDGKWWCDFEDVIEKVDAIEVPGKHPHLLSQYQGLAQKYSKTGVSGSDAHTWIQVGVGKTLVATGFLDEGREENFIRKFKKVVTEGMTVPCVHKSAEEVLRLSSYYRNRCL